MKSHRDGSVFGLFHQGEPERENRSPTNSLLSVSHEIFDCKQCGHTQWNRCQAIWTDSVIISIFICSILEKDFRVDGMTCGYVNELRGHGDKVGLECHIYFFNFSTISDFFIRSGFGKEKWIVFIIDAIFSVSPSSCYLPGIYETT